MANLCEKLLNACIGADCSNPIYSGIDSNAWLFNKSEVSFTYDETNPNIITDFVMATYTDGSDDVTAHGYTVQQLGKTPYTGTNTTMVEGNVSNKFTNNFAFVIPDNSPAAAEVLDNLANGKFVAVIKNEYDGSDHRGQFQVYGAKKGLVASAMENDKYSEDTDGGWAITLTETGTPSSAIFLEHKTDTVVDTEDYLNTLVDCE